MSNIEHLPNWVSSLKQSYGNVRAPVCLATCAPFYNKERYTEIVRNVKQQFMLPCNVRVGYVNQGGPKNAPLWLRLPKDVPLFGTRAFLELQLTLFIRKSFLEVAPYETFIIGLAHEFSHVVLESTQHKYRSIEPFVDLTAMFFGYQEYYLRHSVFMLPNQKLDWWTQFHSWWSRKPVELRMKGVGYLTESERQYAATLLKHTSS